MIGGGGVGWTISVPGPVGAAAVGGVVGLITGRGSVIATACYGTDSPETQLALMYKFKYVGPSVYRGYLRFGSPIAAGILKHPWLRPLVKWVLVNPILRAMQAELEERPRHRNWLSRQYLKGWLKLCHRLGRSPRKNVHGQVRRPR